MLMRRSGRVWGEGEGGGSCNKNDIKTGARRVKKEGSGGSERVERGKRKERQDRG